MSDSVKKLLIAAVVILAAVPVLPFILPKAVTFERILAGFEAAQVPVENCMDNPQPGLESIAEKDMTIGTANVAIYQYDNSAVLTRQLGNQQKDPGQAMVQAWGLAQSLGAAVPKEIPYLTASRGKFMIIATGEDKALLQRIIDVFNGF
jgi:hypothetical protein